MADKTYIIKKQHEVLKITVPEEWKVTYGPIQPGSREYGGGNYVRFYESDKQQRAVFANVLEFVEDSIKIERKVKTHKESSSSRKSKGRSEAEAVYEESWETSTEIF